MTYNRYITLDGNKYAIDNTNYQRAWIRQFTMSISAAVININFVDRGPGVRTYVMTLILNSWATDSTPYQDGITGSVDTQKASLEASYNKLATALSFTDPFGDTLTKGVYFTKLTQLIPPYSVPNKVIIAYQIELTEAGKETT